MAMGRDHGLAHGSMRFSLGMNTTQDDLAYTVEELVKVVNRLRAMSPLYKKAMAEKKSGD